MNVNIAQRLEKLDWLSIRQSLRDYGYALTPALLSGRECADLCGIYPSDQAFRSHIIMSRYRFGRGDYKYFDYPLPAIVQELREASYPYLVPIANEWNENLRAAKKFPPSHSAFLAACKKSGQTRATPLLLHYAPGD